MRDKRAPVSAQEKVASDAAQRPFAQPAMTISARNDEVGFQLLSDGIQLVCIVALRSGRHGLGPDAMMLEPVDDVREIGTGLGQVLLGGDFDDRDMR